MKITRLFNDFFESEKAGGVILLVCTAFSLFAANSRFGETYHHFWQPLEYWINDGLMTIFFLLIGLELEREIYDGELSDFREATLPIFGALGGMFVPATCFLLFNFGTPTQSGAGIPMATDIAFAVGILSLLGDRVPLSLKVFLTALAVIDDLGAILVIAVFYSKTIFWGKLLTSLAIFALLLAFNRLKVRSLVPYLVGGVAMWYFMLQSGVHATITGVMLAFALPFGKGDKTSTSYILQDYLHRPVAFFILPVFALANTAIILDTDFSTVLFSPYSVGIAVGLIVGKPLGISLFSFLAIRLKVCQLPSDLRFKTLIGVSFLGGIGFTMSIFITLLAFNSPNIINNAKLVILLASLIAGIIGYFWLQKTLQT